MRQGKGPTSYSDDTVREVMRDCLTSMSIPQAARRHGIPWETVSKWMSGQCRGSLLREVEQEVGRGR